MTNDLISRSVAKEEILSWAVCINKPHLLSKDDTLHVLDTLPAVDAVSREVVDQIMWERDIAMEQLKEHGIPFGGIAPNVVAVVRCKDCWWYQIRKWDDGKPEYDCRRMKGLLDVRPEDFCSFGERRAE